jgi:hypothetical protein
MRAKTLVLVAAAAARWRRTSRRRSSGANHLPALTLSDDLSSDYLTAIMVRVWYEPPPFGPGTDLNRSGYGIGGGGMFKTYLEKAAKQPRMVALAPWIFATLALSYIPLSKCLYSKRLLFLSTRSNCTSHCQPFRFRFLLLLLCAAYDTHLSAVSVRI